MTDDLNSESNQRQNLVGENKVESRFLLVGPKSANDDPSTSAERKRSVSLPLRRSG